MLYSPPPSSAPHDHDHAHGVGGHCHHDDNPNLTDDLRGEKMKALRWALVLTGLYFWAELVGGVWSGSLALLADSGHMFSDMAGLGLALFASWLSGKKSSSRQTFGLYRAEVLVAFINGLLLAGVAFLILSEAWQRLHNPHPIQGPLMLGIAVGGLIINLMVIKVLHGDSHGGSDAHKHDLNLRAAYLHVLGDLLGSVGTIVAAGCLTWLGWAWADPVISGIIALLVLVSAYNLLVDATHILLENSPAHLPVDKVAQTMSAIEGVLAVHDLHIWTISSHRHALSAHVTVSPEASQSELLTNIQHTLASTYGLNHVTLQLEPPGYADDRHACHQC
ncbi:MAG: cation diffusion facilitator family transporter [Vampirovibrionales bacterium]|nr:cation diffusion facilitator family transporter [Vampirovibrionales bacterium]